MEKRELDFLDMVVDDEIEYRHPVHGKIVDVRFEAYHDVTVYEDGYDFDEACAAVFSGDNLLETVFKDGKCVREYTLNEVRQNLHGGMF